MGLQGVRMRRVMGTPKCQKRPDSSEPLFCLSVLLQVNLAILKALCLDNLKLSRGSCSCDDAG